MPDLGGNTTNRTNNGTTLQLELLKCEKCHYIWKTNLIYITNFINTNYMHHPYIHLVPCFYMFLLSLLYIPPFYILPCFKGYLYLLYTLIHTALGRC